MGTCPAHHKISAAFWLPAPPYSSCDSHSRLQTFPSVPLASKSPLIENPCTRLFCLLWNFPSLLISLFLLSTGLKQIIRVCANSPNGRGHHAQPILGLHTSGRTLCSVCWLWPLKSQGALINAGLPDDYSCKRPPWPSSDQSSEFQGFLLTPKHIMPFHLFIFLKNHGTLGDPGCRVKLTDP